MKLDPYLTPYTNLSCKYVIVLNVRTKTIKLPVGNTRINLYDLGLSNDFIDMTPKPQAIHEKIDKWDLRLLWF